MNKVAIEEIKKRIDPDTFITLTTRQAIQSPSGAVIHASPEVYDRVLRSAYNKLNRRFYGKRAWRRRTRFMPNLSVIEKGRDGRWHIHACLKRPSHVKLEQFKAAFHEVWSASEWFMKHYTIEELDGGGFSYILKDGQDAILVGASNF